MKTFVIKPDWVCSLGAVYDTPTVYSYGLPENILKKLNIEYDHVWDSKKNEKGDCKYFFKDTKEIAHYSYLMLQLIILTEPRDWGANYDLLVLQK
jgi:hypothetical protein